MVSILTYLKPSIASESQNILKTNLNLSIEEKVDQYVQDLDDTFFGTILIAIGDSILLNRGYGMSNLSYDIPNEANTKYMIGSTTKPFTKVILLKLIDQGIIEMDATIDNYLPEYPKKNATRITIRHLLFHTSGIPHHMFAIPNYFGEADQIFHTPIEYLKLFWENDLLHEPGERMTYTSLGYYILAVILERVTHKSFSELLDEYIFQPLYLQNTSYFNNLNILKKMATGYKKGIRGLVLAGTEEVSNCLGSNGIISTSEDLYKFQRILNLQEDRILNIKSKRNLLSSLTPGLITKISYNKGRDTLTVVSPGFGSSYGYRAYVERILEKDACIIVMSNIQDDFVMTYDMFADLRALLLNELNIIPDDLIAPSGTDDASSFHLKAEQLDKYEGFYKSSSGPYIHIFKEGKLLFRRASSQQFGIFGNPGQTRELIPISDTKFLIKGRSGLQYNFIKSPDMKKHLLEIVFNNRPQGTVRPVNLIPDFDLSEYKGFYYSLELQKTYEFSIEGNTIAVPDFIQNENIFLVPLEKDIFGCKYGFVYFHRDEEEKIWGFKLENDKIETLLGSIFIKK